MDTLVALGATAAFAYSTFALFAMTDAEVKGDIEKVLSYMHEFYDPHTTVDTNIKEYKQEKKYSDAWNRTELPHYKSNYR